MKKIFAFVLLSFLALFFTMRAKSLTPNEPLSLKSLVLLSANPTIVLKEVPNESNTFTDGKSFYTYRNSYYNYYSCAIGWDFHIKKQNGECLALKKQELISETEIKAYNQKLIPKERIFKMPNYVFKPSATDFLITYKWVRVLLSDITENAYIPVTTQHIDIFIYRLSLSQDLTKTFLIDAGNNEYFLVNLKANYESFIQQHKKNIDNYQSYLKKNKVWNKFQKEDQDQKVEKAYNYIINNYTYNHKYLENKETHYKGMNAINTMQDKTWVCGGFAGAMVYMLDAQWIETRKIDGLSCMEWTCENHSWVAVKYGDKWKYFDPTFEQWTQEINEKWTTPYFFWKLPKQIFELNHFPWKFKNIDGVTEKDYVEKTNKQIENYVQKHNNSLLEKLSKWDKISSYPELYLWNKMQSQ